MFNLFNRKKITEKLFEQNLELAVKNKTLSLLEELYQKSVLNLTPDEVAREITDIIRQDLHLELAGILIFHKKDDTLVPLAFSKSERLAKTLSDLGFLFSDIIIEDIANREFFKKVVYGKENNMTNNLQEVWQEMVSQEDINEIKKESHIKTTLMYPLMKDSGVMGVLLLGFNRDYNTLNTFEKASIKSFINVIALLLGKAYLYKDLQDSYEVTKRAYALEKRAKEDINKAYGIEKKANEELEKIDKEKDDFLRLTQHDLRKPLTIIMGYTDLLISGTFGKLPKKAQDIIKRIHTVNQSKITDINSFLDAERWKMKQTVSLTPGVELVPMMDEIVSVLDADAQLHGIYLKFEKPKKSIKVSADREILKAALFNIISNAIKFTPKGGVDIKIENAKIKMQNSPQSVVIVIKDTGIGVPQDKLKSIFEEEFERTEQAKKTASGSGVGLPGSAKIIKMHNGKVWAESAGEGKGSTFYVELPMD